MSKIPFPRLTKSQVSNLTIIVVAVAAIVGGFLSRSVWLPRSSQLLVSIQERFQGPGRSEDFVADDHGQADAGAGHSAVISLAMSEQAQKNVGLQLATVELRDFDRTITVPGMVAERPGRTEIRVSAPMTGIVTRVYPIRGEAVQAGQPLFDLRFTHEDLVEIQSQFLQTVERLDVIKREVSRLDKITSSGAIAGNRLLERQYEQQQAEALLRAQQQALILHGLSEDRVNSILTTRRLLQDVTIIAPKPSSSESHDEHEEFLQVAELGVTPGEHVVAGARLCTLADYCELYIEGKAFEEDAPELTEAANLGAAITAVIEENGKGTRTVSGLPILYVENQVARDSRALLFYLPLANEVVRNETTSGGHRFIGWRYRPGQRVHLALPVETWKNCIVLPIDAVVKEGAEYFVFQQNGKRFDRRPVHVEYRDRRWAVIASDGSLFPGDVVAASGAYQIHLAMKNKAGGGVDPHAGHNH